MSDLPTSALCAADLQNTVPEVAPEKIEVIDSIHGYASEQLSLLLDTERAWQPADYLPDSRSESFFDEVRDLQEEVAELPDDVLVALVGDMVTEEALPSYQTMINRLAGTTDLTGVAQTPWALWSRAWTAEENRHGDLLNRFLYLSGRVDMRSIEMTVQNLIRDGFNGQMESDPYKGFIYTSFQERATKVSHANVAKLAKKFGNDLIGRICQIIAGDEARHEEAYKRFMDKIFEIDPANSMMAFKEMMQSKIVMPAALMSDCETEDLFDKFSNVAQRIGVYTAHDYADIIDHLVERWRIEVIGGLKDEAAKAQEYLSTLATRYRKLADRAGQRIISEVPVQFPWIEGRAV